MNIYFYIRVDYLNDKLGKVVTVSGIDEMKAYLEEFLTKNNHGKMVYNWLSDGACGMGLEIGSDVDTKTEFDIEKMLGMVSDRVNEFGWCSFEGEFGDFGRIVVRDRNKKDYEL